MKNSLKNLLWLLAALTFALSSCEKDDDDATEEKKEDDKAYVGTWKSAVYPREEIVIDTNTQMPVFIDTIAGTPIPALDTNGYEQMEFTFTNTTFSDKISRGGTATAIAPQVIMSGNMSTTETTMDAEITDIELVGVTSYNKTDEPEEFKVIFAQTVGAMLDEEFDVTYTINSDTLKLNLIVKTNVPGITAPTTITLIKQ